LTPATTPFDAGYDALGVDPEALDRPEYRQISFEEYRPDAPVDAVIASLSLLLDADAAAEQAAIDAGAIKAGCLRYAGRRTARR
jgi:hypothetical protein